MLVTVGGLLAALEAINLEEVIGLDTETTGLGESDRAFQVIVSTAQEDYVFDERSCPSFMTGLNFTLKFKKKIVVFQHAKFDIRMCASIGIEFHPDTEFVDDNSLARLVRNDHFGARAYSLGAQAKRELGDEKLDKEIKDFIKANNLYEDRKNFFGEVEKAPRYDWVPLDLMTKYSSKDGNLTRKLYFKYMSLLDAREKDVAANENRLIKTCYKMERRGLKINVPRTIKALYHEQGLIDSSKLKYKELTGQDYVNSAKSVQKVLDYRLPLTEDGNPSLTDDVIEEIISGGIPKDVEIATTVRFIRGYEKRVGTYFKSYLNFMDSEHVIHPTMWIAGTRTGRFSYSDPNLQNIPKDSEEERDTYSVRECFEPRPGRTYVSFDFKQMEYCMMAAYANETEIIRAVMNGADFHQATADLLGITRKLAKTLNFAILYGAGVEKIAWMLGITVSEARRLKDKYFMALPKVEALVDRIIRTGRSRGYVTNWFGRKLYADRQFAYALPNHLIQGGGADVVKVAMNRIDEHPELGKLWMVLQVHDQLVFELTDEEMKYIPLIKKTMEEVFPEMNGMKLSVDVSVSKRSLAEKDMEKYECEAA